jgi:hypothetical protein
VKAFSDTKLRLELNEDTMNPNAEPVPTDESSVSRKQYRWRANARVIVGYLVAPAVSPAILYFIARKLQDPHPMWGASVIACVAYFAAIALGGPCYLVMRAKRISKLAPYAIAGALIGVACSLIFSLLIVASHLAAGWSTLLAGVGGIIANFVRITGYAAVSGALSAIVFWIVAVRNSEAALD